MLSTLTYAVRVDASPDQAQVISDTCSAYLGCCNMVSETAWEHRTISQKALHQLVYRRLRDEYRVKSQMAQSSIIRVIGNYRTIKEMHGSPWATSQPEYRSSGYDLVWNRDYSILKDGRLSINTLNGRIKVSVDWAARARSIPSWQVRHRKATEQEREVAPTHPQHRGTTRTSQAATSGGCGHGGPFPRHHIRQRRPYRFLRREGGEKQTRALQEATRLPPKEGDAQRKAKAQENRSERKPLDAGRESSGL